MHFLSYVEDGVHFFLKVGVHHRMPTAVGDHLAKSQVYM